MDGFVVALQSDCFHKTSWTIDDWGHYTVQWAAVKTHQNSVQIQSLQNPWQCELCVHKSLLDVIIHLQDLVWGCSCFLLALGWWRESKPAASIWTWSSSNWCYYPNGLRTWCWSIVALNASTCPNLSQDAPTCANKRQCHKMAQDVTRFTPKLRQVVGADETDGPHKLFLHVFYFYILPSLQSLQSHQ